MTDYDKLNTVFEKILNEQERFSLDPRVLGARLIGKNRGIGAADTETRNIFVNEFISQGLNALQSAISSGIIGTTGAASAEDNPEPVTFGGMKYTKGPNGWIDKRGKKADQNTAQILDKVSKQAASSKAVDPSIQTSNSISNFMINWFDTYMRGSKINSNMAPQQVKDVADRIQKAYEKEKGGSLFRREGQPGKETQTEMARLGHLAWSLYHTRMGYPNNNNANRDGSGTGGGAPGTGGGAPGTGGRLDSEKFGDNTPTLTNLSNITKAAVAMLNKFDQDTKFKAISAILNGTNMVANVDQIVSAIDADKMNRADLEALIKAAERKLGNPDNPQDDFFDKVAVGSNVGPNVEPNDRKNVINFQRPPKPR